MLKLTANALKVFLAPDPCDRRKSVNGLKILYFARAGTCVLIVRVTSDF